MPGVEGVLDTNILVYAFSPGEGIKWQKAQALLVNCQALNLAVSFQVIQEFINVALRKSRPAISGFDLGQVLDHVLLPLCRIWPSADFYREALATQMATGLSWYDSLILQGALECRAPKLYSEDLQEGYRYRSVTVVNPFR